MTDSGRQLDWIVAEVLRRLAAGNHSGLPAVPEARDGAGESTVEARVVSLETLQQCPRQFNKLRLRSDAVITPAARDELKVRSVEVEFISSESRAELSPQFYFAAVGREMSFWMRSVIATTTPEGELELLSSDEQAVEAAVESVRAGTPAVLWSTRPLYAACLANRLAHVWAVSVANLASLQRATKDMRVNLLVLNQSATEAHVQRSMLRHFLRVVNS